jgi:hypothetical protein
MKSQQGKATVANEVDNEGKDKKSAQNKTEDDKSEHVAVVVGSW